MGHQRVKDARPAIASLKTGEALKRWYWRKDELVAHAKSLGLKSTGGKFDILDRIAHFLDTGAAPPEAKPKSKSKFDWHKEPLTPDTVLTDSYKNSQNVRRFFKSQLGDGFKFNIEFMAWLKSNAGKTLAEACTEYRAMKQREADPAFRTKIAHHNQFNQYTRDFLDAHPDASLDDVRKYWSLKIQQPSDTGRHTYHPDDLKLAD